MESRQVGNSGSNTLSSIESDVSRSSTTSTRSESDSKVVATYASDAPRRDLKTLLSTVGMSKPSQAFSQQSSDSSEDDTENCFEDPSPRTPHSRNLLQFNRFVGADDALLSPRGRFQRCQSIAPPLELTINSFHGSFSSVASSLFSHHKSRASKVFLSSKVASLDRKSTVDRKLTRLARVTSDQQLRIANQSVRISKVMSDPERLSSQLAGLIIGEDRLGDDRHKAQFSPPKQKRWLHKPFQRPAGASAGVKGSQAGHERVGHLALLDQGFQNATKERSVRKRISSGEDQSEAKDAANSSFRSKKQHSQNHVLFKSDSKKQHNMKLAQSLRSLLPGSESGEDHSKHAELGTGNGKPLANGSNDAAFMQQSRKLDVKGSLLSRMRLKKSEPPVGHRSGSHGQSETSESSLDEHGSSKKSS